MSPQYKEGGGFLEFQLEKRHFQIVNILDARNQRPGNIVRTWFMISLIKVYD